MGSAPAEGIPTLELRAVGADKTVLLGDPFTFSKENIDHFDF